MSEIDKHTTKNNSNYMLAELLVNNVVKLNLAYGTDPLIVPHTGLHKTGIFSYTSVGVEEIEFLYRMYEIDPVTGHIAWALNKDNDKGVSPETTDTLTQKGWNVEELLDYVSLMDSRVTEIINNFRLIKN